MEPQEPHIEVATLFDGSDHAALSRAQSLLRSWPQLLEGALSSCDLGYRVSSHFLMAVARLDSRRYGPEVRARLDFWTLRSGGSCIALSGISRSERMRVAARLKNCDLSYEALPPAGLSEALSKIHRAASTLSEGDRGGQKRLMLELSLESTHHPKAPQPLTRNVLFVPSVALPPLGDRMRLLLGVPQRKEPMEVDAQVVRVHAARRGAGGTPAGFEVRLLGAPEEVQGALAVHAASSRESRARRSTGRFRFKAEAVLTAAVPAPARQQITLSYDCAETLRRDYVENLSAGGALVKSERPFPVETLVQVKFALPDGGSFEAPGRVGHATADSMGIQFELDAAGRGRLESASAELRGKVRRALVIDDDALMRAMLADALEAHGFEVLRAKDGREGLEVLLDELLTLDVLVTDLHMPRMDGEALMAFIRGPGGERDLPIIAVSGSLPEGDPGATARFGADAVFSKALGPEAVAKFARDTVDRKLRQRADAGEEP